MNENTNLTYYQKKRDVMLNKVKREQARDKHRNLSDKEKIKKREYGKNRYHIMSEEIKQRLKEYRKNYREARKPQYNNE